jgi:putative tryptophan/tyrosine transport system substrate-binding protein
VWRLDARAQQPPPPVIGFLNSQSPATFGHLAAAFSRGLSQVGFIEGQNVVIEYRWAEGHYEKLPDLAADLVHRQVAVLVATGGEPTSVAAKAATSTIPIVFAIGGDPIKGGFVDSLNRPNGNMTGLTQFTAPLEGKRLGLLHELVPNAAIATLVNPTFLPAEEQMRELKDAAARGGVRIIPLTSSGEGNFEPAFAAMAKEGAGAVLIASDPYFNNRRERLVELAQKYKLPAIYEFREFTASGGLMSYGGNLAGGYRQVGIYAGAILKGRKPSDLPVLQPTRFEFVINLTTAKAFGVEVPPMLLARADEVIE